MLHHCFLHLRQRRLQLHQACGAWISASDRRLQCVRTASSGSEAAESCTPPSPLRILFFGTCEVAVASLQALWEHRFAGCEVDCICSKLLVHGLTYAHLPRSTQCRQQRPANPSTSVSLGGACGCSSSIRVATTELLLPAFDLSMTHTHAHHPMCRLYVLGTRSEKEEGSGRVCQLHPLPASMALPHTN